MGATPTRTDWPWLVSLGLSALAHAGLVATTAWIASGYDPGAARTADGGLVFTRETADVPPPPPPPAPLEPPVEQPEPPKPPEVTLGRDDSDEVTATWIGAAPNEATEASGVISTIDQAGYSLPTGAPEPIPAGAPGAPGQESEPAPKAPLSIVRAAPKQPPSEPGAPAEIPPKDAPTNKPTEAAPTPAATDPAQAPARTGDPASRDEQKQEKQDPAELLERAQRLLTEASALLADREATRSDAQREGPLDAPIDPAKPDARDDKDQELLEEKLEQKPGGAPDGAPEGPIEPSTPSAATPAQPRDRLDNFQSQRPPPPETQDAIEDDEAATDALPSEQPQGAPAQGREPVPQGPVPDSTSGELSDREAIATAIREAIRVEPGKPVASKGITVKTFRPRWSHFTLITAAPQNAVVRVSFNREGRAVDVQLLRSSGRTDVDRPLIDAVYNWTASGKQISALPEKRPDGKPGLLSMTFEIILGR